MRDLHFIPECYIDTNLTETLLAGLSVNHQKGCGTVSVRMQTNFSDDFAVGILDKDKKDINYLREFETISSTDHLILHKHPNKHHYIIQVVPAMENFLINALAEIGLTVADFDLPENFEKLKKRSKTVNSKDDPTFKKVFKRLMKEGASQILILKEWLTYLHEKRYNVDLSKLRNIEG